MGWGEINLSTFTLSLTPVHTLSLIPSLSFSLSLWVVDRRHAGDRPDAGGAGQTRWPAAGGRAAWWGSNMPPPSLFLSPSSSPSLHELRRRSSAGAALEAAPAAAAPDQAGRAGGRGRKAGPRARAAAAVGFENPFGFGFKTQPVKNPTRFHLKR